MTSPAQTPVNPTWTWGSSAIIRLQSQPTSSVQLAQISLPEPAVCSIYLQARVIFNADARDVVQAFTVNLIQGVGRVAVPRTLTFQGQPAVTGPLELTIPWVPLHALQVNIEAVGLFFSGAPDLQIETYMILSPLTRIPQKEQQLAFGMATPGEADDLDDGLREELEAEGPTVQRAMAEGRSTVDGSDGDDGEQPEQDDDGDDGDGGEPEPELTGVQKVALALEQKLGRRPTRIELQATVKRLRDRAARRRGR